MRPYLSTLALVPSCVVLLAGCGESGDGAGAGPAPGGDAAAPSAYPRDAVIRMNQLQVLATHNSYHVEKEGNVIPDWQYSRDPLFVQLGEQGVRGLEIDTHHDAANDTILVHHVPTVDDGTVCSTFAGCLGEIAAWSAVNPMHHALFIQIEPKESSLNNTTADFPAYADLLDRIILEVFDRARIITPADVKGEAPTLREAVTTTGWPTLGESRGKVLFYLNEREGFHTAYTRGGGDLEGRVAFPESRPDEDIGAVVILNNPTSAEIPGVVQEGFIVRTMVDSVPPPADAEARRTAGLSSGAHVLSTDYPVEGALPAFVVPGGTPSRCNPVALAEACSPADIEHPPVP